MAQNNQEQPASDAQEFREGARFVATFLNVLFRPKECTCELWRHPNDPDGGLCTWCEDEPARELIELFADEPNVEEEDLWLE